MPAANAVVAAVEAEAGVPAEPRAGLAAPRGASRPARPQARAEVGRPQTRARDTCPGARHARAAARPGTARAVAAYPQTDSTATQGAFGHAAGASHPTAWRQVRAKRGGWFDCAETKCTSSGVSTAWPSRNPAPCMREAVLRAPSSAPRRLASSPGPAVTGNPGSSTVCTRRCRSV